MKLDHLDLDILKVIQSDADITNEVLSQRLHTSVATCQRRLKRLKDVGAIEKIVAIVRPDAVGTPLIAIVEVTMTSQSAEVLADFESRIGQVLAVQQCYRVSTGPDFILVLTLTNMESYQQIAGEVFTASNHVRNVRTFFSIQRTKFSTAVPIHT